MKKHLTVTLLAVLPLATVAAGQAQTGRGQGPPPPPKPMAVVAPRQLPSAQGKLEGGIYSNDFFGFSFTVKPEWITMDAATRKAVTAVGRETVERGVTERKKAELEAAMARTDFLLSVSKYEVNKPTPEFNALLMCLAERVPTAIMKTGADYMAAALSALKGTAAKAELVGRVRSEPLGGVPFTVADVRLTAGAIVVMQRYYVKLEKGYALTFVYSYVDEADLRHLEEMMKTVRFKRTAGS